MAKTPQQDAIELARTAVAASTANNESTTPAADSGRTGRAPTAEEMAQADAADTAKKHSPKHRETRGVPAGWSTTWVPVDVEPGRAAMIEKVVKYRNSQIPEPAEGQKKATVKVTDIYLELIAKAYEIPGVFESLQAEADKAPDTAAKSLAAMTPEKLEKKIEASKALLAKTMAMLELAKAAQAGNK